MNEEIKKAVELSDEQITNATGGTGGCIFYDCPNCGTKNEHPQPCSNCSYIPPINGEILTVDILM